MFILPNNKKIDEDAVIDAMLEENPVKKYLNLETGKVESKSNLNSVEIPKADQEDKIAWMSDFMDGLIKFEDADLYKKLLVIISSKNGYQKCLDILSEEKDDWLTAWESWEDDTVFFCMKGWFESLNIEIKKEMEYFDDCPVCQAMKFGLNSPDELKAAFKAAKEKGFHVGGPLLDEEEE